LSVGFKVIDYEMVAENSPNFSALIKRAELTEVSCVITPSNPACVITFKMHQPAASVFYTLMARRVQILIQRLQLHKEQAA
jgi:hypothetical protein